MATETTVEALAQLALFADLTPAQLEAAAHVFDEEVFAEGQRVLRHGLSGSSFYVILEGEAAVTVDERELSRLRRGDYFGEISALTGEVPSADVTALSLLRCLVMPAAELEQFLLDRPAVMMRLLRAEARRLRSAGQWQ